MQLKVVVVDVAHSLCYPTQWQPAPTLNSSRPALRLQPTLHCTLSTPGVGRDDDELPLHPFHIPLLMLMIAPSPNCYWVKISKVSLTDGPKSPKNYFNKYLTLWTCQTYLENMFTALKSKEIIFEALFFVQKLRQLQTFLKFLPLCEPSL